MSSNLEGGKKRKTAFSILTAFLVIVSIICIGEIVARINHYFNPDPAPTAPYDYRAAGYGTLQEYLILEKYIDAVKPDVVVLQLCSNDFIDNYHRLEIEAGYKVGKKRPYLNLKDEVVHKVPLPFIDRIKEYSRFVFFLANRSRKFWKEQIVGKEPDLAEKLIAEQGSNYALFNHTLALTQLALKRFKEQTNSQVKLLVFVSDAYQPQYDSFKQICVEQNISFLDGVPFQVQEAYNSGTIVHSHDGYHWNETGHQIIANAILPDLRKALNN